MADESVRRGRGRPKEDLYQKYVAGHEDAVEEACQNGTDIKGLAMLLGCSAKTISTIKREYPEFRQLVEVGNIVADDEIVSALYKRAKGYNAEETVTEVKISPDGSAQTTYVKKVTKHIPPDTTAAIFWLKNRKRKEWSDRQDVEVQSTEPITINILRDATGGRKTE